MCRSVPSRVRCRTVCSSSCTLMTLAMGICSSVLMQSLALDWVISANLSLRGLLFRFLRRRKQCLQGRRRWLCLPNTYKRQTLMPPHCLVVRVAPALAAASAAGRGHSAPKFGSFAAQRQNPSICVGCMTALSDWAPDQAGSAWRPDAVHADENDTLPDMRVRHVTIRDTETRTGSTPYVVHKCMNTSLYILASRRLRSMLLT